MFHSESTAHLCSFGRFTRDRQWSNNDPIDVDKDYVLPSLSTVDCFSDAALPSFLPSHHVLHHRISISAAAARRHKPHGIFIKCLRFLFRGKMWWREWRMNADVILREIACHKSNNVSVSPSSLLRGTLYGIHHFLPRL